jgi:hypothetical protein
MGRRGPAPGAHENRPSTRTDLERQSAIWMTASGQKPLFGVGATCVRYSPSSRRCDDRCVCSAQGT